MADKVLHEIKVIETDDGYRIEINGDKERIQKMFFGRPMWFAPWMAGGRGRHRGPGRKGFKKHRSRDHHHHHHEYHHYDEYDLGPWWDTEPPDEEKPTKTVS